MKKLVKKNAMNYGSVMAYCKSCSCSCNCNCWKWWSKSGERNNNKNLTNTINQR